MANWLGVDVGAAKGFDVAVVDERSVIALEGRLRTERVVELVCDHRPQVVGIDGPRSFARDGERLRECERRVARSICGIRWTPDARAVAANPGYYGWIVSGLALYDALADVAAEVIEVFPTAAWTRWHGNRGRQTRAAWTADALRRLGLAGVPRRTNQDVRDAIAAAVTAREHARGMTEAIGEIVVPRRREARISQLCGDAAPFCPSAGGRRRP